MSGVLRGFVKANQRLARPIEERRRGSTDIAEVYARLVAETMRGLAPGSLVVDVGGGRSCLFAEYRAPNDGLRLVGVDISADELALNEDVDETLVADVVQGLPFADAEADLVVTRSVVEHLVDSEAYIAHAARVLKPGGMLINLLPSKYAPFALINRALPEHLKRRVLYFMWPESQGRLGFRAYYDNCSYRGMRRVLERNGFELVSTRASYYQAEYFALFFPAYLINVAYEMAIERADVKQLAASLLMVARKR